MKTALIGHTGFVGSNLAEQNQFSELYNSKNISDIIGKDFDLVVCAGVTANKFWSNNHEQLDRLYIDDLISNLKSISTRYFVLISTIDVYSIPINVNEKSPITNDNHAYGINRFYLEEWVKDSFKKYSVIRLPGLFGKGLKKNVIFDLIHDNCLDMINSQNVYQYYNLDNIWKDISKVIANEIQLINFSTEPIPTAEIIQSFFPEKKIAANDKRPVKYDFRSVYSKLWGRDDEYLYGKNDIMMDLSKFIYSSK